MVRISNPDRVYFSARGETKLDLANYVIAVADGHRPGAARAAVRAQPPPRRLRRRQDLPEAGAQGRARLGRDRPGRLPVRADRRRAVRDRAGERGLGRADVARSSSTPGTPAGPPPSIRTSCASTSTRSPAPGSPRSARRGRGAARCSTSSGCRLAQDVRQRGIHIYVRILPRPRLHRRPPGRAGSRPGGRAARPGAGDHRLVEGGAGRAVFVDYNQIARDQTIASAYCVRGVPATVSAPLTWDEVPDAELRDFTIATDAGPVRRARRRARRHRRRGRGRSSPCWSWPTGTSVTAGWRRAVSAELPEDGGRAEAGPAVPDGGTAGGFLRFVADCIESPIMALGEL